MSEQKKKAVPMEIEGLDEYTGFPVYFVSEGEEIDFSQVESPIAYFMTGKGMYIYSNNGVFETLTPADNGISGLAEVIPQCHYTLAKMPKNLVLQIIGFFAWANKEHGSEAIVLPYYNKETKKWKIIIPEQEVSGGNCQYTVPTEGIPEGYDRIGSWHSHASMTAFHSSIDTHDEQEGDDGIHITAGDFTSFKNKLQKPSVVASIVAYGYRWTLNPSAIFTLKVEEKVIPQSLIWKGGQKYAEPERKEHYLCLEEGDSLEFPEAWKKKVTARKIQIVHDTGYTYGGVGAGGLGFYQGGGGARNTVRCYQCGNYAANTTITDTNDILEWLKIDAEGSNLFHTLDKYIEPHKVNTTVEFQNGMIALHEYMRSNTPVDKNGKKLGYIAPKTILLASRVSRFKNWRKAFVRAAAFYEKQEKWNSHSTCLDRKSLWNREEKSLEVKPIPTGWERCAECNKFEASIGFTHERVISEWQKNSQEYAESRKALRESNKVENNTTVPDSEKTCDTCTHFWNIATYEDALNVPANCERQDYFVNRVTMQDYSVFDEAADLEGCPAWEEGVAEDDVIVSESDKTKTIRCAKCGTVLNHATQVWRQGSVYCTFCDKTEDNYSDIETID